MSKDILFKTENDVFSYRIGGILIRDNKILLQKPKNDDGFSIPGGHVNFGEASSEALIREFKEEINADIKIERLVFVGENFFPWGRRPCHQISLYYAVSLCSEEQIPLTGTFQATDDLGNERIDLDFSWIALDELSAKKVYPTNLMEDLISLPEQVKHFIYVQE
ncbi:hypothetical protein acsn021_20350 [Anaerocolumna cellulosilytica]|uniref:Uncharacterized protein n=1 Tax=Anaerocolumna cellulosilytica TaxID=433286 RepID=A0A6S6QXL0_9FIRM|nr:NUDIX hydrolase [Anaerocolumna cellulosilytica]MBB5196412.1 ADP-ribose pyrophosphatase YjhB (NUDIX family) [Anaerocolumna cellulosilytica]BCJ94466.1 hypothetical protein acsn021_20350 [Anaerocolumna cellulosilytica]